MNAKRLYDKSIRGHEGFRAKPYKDGNGFWTIGIGEKIHTNTMSFHEAEALMRNGITESAAIERCKQKIMVSEIGARRILGPEVYDQLSDVRQEVLVEMVFQMGATGFARFRETMSFIRNGNHQAAAVEMLDSKWHREDSPGRAETLSERYKANSYDS